MQGDLGSFQVIRIAVRSAWFPLPNVRHKDAAMGDGSTQAVAGDATVVLVCRSLCLL